MQADDARREIATVQHWYHRIEVFPGVVTPGINDTPANQRVLDALGLPTTAAGLRVLDIGCADGYFSFLMERRGAEVIATDYRKPTSSGFAVAARLLESRVEYRVNNVYALSPEAYGTFDIVLFLGVLYHLRHPLLALDRIRPLLRTGGQLFVESQVIDQALLLPNGEFTPLDQLNRKLTGLPLWQFYAGAALANDFTNRWAPNLTALRQVIEEAEFDVNATHLLGPRGYVCATAAERTQTAYSRRLDQGANW